MDGGGDAGFRPPPLPPFPLPLNGPVRDLFNMNSPIDICVDLLLAPVDFLVDAARPVETGAVVESEINFELG